MISNAKQHLLLVLVSFLSLVFLLLLLLLLLLLVLLLLLLLVFLLVLLLLRIVLDLQFQKGYVHSNLADHVRLSEKSVDYS